MNRPGERDRRIEALEGRLSRLGEAFLRIIESLDFDTVVQKVLDSARDLTAARYGVIAMFDVRGRLEAVRSAGTSEEEHRRLVSLPGGGRILAHFLAINGPVRVDNWVEYASSVGLDGSLPMMVGAGLSVPIRHRGRSVGVIWLGHNREEERFSRDDEEALVMFSSQAGMVVANARRYREERQARDDLETLMDTSPVGVAVFDAVSGLPKSFNREASRVVDSLLDPGQSPEDLLEMVTYRRADGRAFFLGESPLAELLGVAETVRAEEVVVCVPDGRSVTLLLNATPIVSEGGAVESVVVTLQDMADVEEQERLRAEFLAMVSHELRVPLTSIKGSASTVLDSPADLDPAVVRQFFRIIADQADHMHALVGDLLDVARIETATLAVRPEPAEITVLVERARDTFRSVAAKNSLAIDIEPDLPLVMADRRRIVQVLGNLLENAARNSSELSTIRVSAVWEGVHVFVSVTDEGRGIRAESLPHLFRKFAKVKSEGQRGDTGLGLAICRGIVEAHGGRIWAESDGPGHGARFTFTLPTVEETGNGTPAVLRPVPTRSPRSSQTDPARRVQVLAVDDDPNDLRYIRDTLIESGYAPVVTADPQDVVRLIEQERPELVLLDLKLPGADGVDLMQDILNMADVPVIFLSVYGRDEVVAKALEMGATDYVVKPFSPTELTARIKAALRRRITTEPSGTYVLGDLTIDYAQRKATLAGQQVPLTPTEYRILAELSAHAGRVLTHRHLLKTVWHQGSDNSLGPMRTMVSKLRRKLGDNVHNPTYIFTEARVGFLMPKGKPPNQKPLTTP